MPASASTKKLDPKLGTSKLTPTQKPLSPARGLVIGSALSLAIWAGIAAIIFG